MSNLTERERNTEMQHALRLAHEALRWLGRVRAWMDTHERIDPNELALLFEVWSVAECCAELHASGEGYGSAITVDDVRELAGWDGEAADVHVRRALGRLVEIGFVDGSKARLVL
jgi:hypothetical protein